jgi:hypothetical protein
MTDLMDQAAKGVNDLIFAQRRYSGVMETWGEGWITDDVGRSLVEAIEKEFGYSEAEIARSLGM